MSAEVRLFGDHMNKKPTRREEFASPAKPMNLHSLGTSSLL